MDLPKERRTRLARTYFIFGLHPKDAWSLFQCYAVCGTTLVFFLTQMPRHWFFTPHFNFSLLFLIIAHGTAFHSILRNTSYLRTLLEELDDAKEEILSEIETRFNREVTELVCWLEERRNESDRHTQTAGSRCLLANDEPADTRSWPSSTW